MIRVSITQVLIGAPQDWITKASAPRTDSSKRTKISPFANSYADCGVSEVPRYLAISSASSGYARPEKTCRFLRLGIEMVFTRGSDRKSTRLNSSHVEISYAVFCLKK